MRSGAVAVGSGAVAVGSGLARLAEAVAVVAVFPTQLSKRAKWLIYMGIRVVVYKSQNVELRPLLPLPLPRPARADGLVPIPGFHALGVTDAPTVQFSLPKKIRGVA
jgi:hypothetical protein